MRLRGNKILCITIEIIASAIQVVNAFFSDIAMYEATTGVSFDFNALISNVFFWIVLAGQIVFPFLFKLIVSHINKQSDSIVEKAYSDLNADLVRQIGELTKRGDYVSIKQVLKILNKIEKRRRRRK